MTGCAVVLPTFNERQTLPPLVAELLEFDTVSQIIVVDDDSPDGTADAIADRWGDSEAVRLIVREDESGLSSAILRGIDEADEQVVANMDGDGQHPPGAAIACAQAVRGGADLAVGTRRAAGGRVDDDWPAHRRVISWGATALAWAAVPRARQLRDPMSGLFAVDRRLVEAVRDQLRPHGYKILLELLARCPIEDMARVGYTFRERAEGASNLGLAEHIRYVRHLGRLTVPARRADSEPHPDVEVVDE